LKRGTDRAEIMQPAIEESPAPPGVVVLNIIGAVWPFRTLVRAAWPFIINRHHES
jgi:hypothetical protein